MVTVESKLSKSNSDESLFNQVKDSERGYCFETNFKSKGKGKESYFVQKTYVSNDMGNVFLNVYDSSKGFNIISLSSTNKLALHKAFLSEEIATYLDLHGIKSDAKAFYLKVDKTLRSQSKVTKFFIEGTDLYVTVDAKNITLSSKNGEIKQIYKPEGEKSTFDFQINPEMTKLMLNPKNSFFAFVGTNDKNYHVTKNLIANLDPKEILACAMSAPEIADGVRVFNSNGTPQILWTQIHSSEKSTENILAVKFGKDDIYVLGNFNDKTSFQKIESLSFVRTQNNASNNFNCELVINPAKLSANSKVTPLGIKTQLPSEKTPNSGDLNKKKTIQNMKAMQILDSFVGADSIKKTDTKNESYELYFTPDNSVVRKTFNAEGRYQDFSISLNEKEAVKVTEEPVKTDPDVVDKETKHEKETETPTTDSDKPGPGDTSGVVVEATTTTTDPKPEKTEPETPVEPTLTEAEKPVEEEKKEEETKVEPTETESPDKKEASSSPSSDKKSDKKEAPSKPEKKKDDSILGSLGFILIAAAVLLCLLAPFLSISTLAFAGLIVGVAGGACMAAENARFNPTKEFNQTYSKELSAQAQREKDIEKLLEKSKSLDSLDDKLSKKGKLNKKEENKRVELRNGICDACSNLDKDKAKLLMDKLKTNEARTEFIGKYGPSLVEASKKDPEIENVIKEFGEEESKKFDEVKEAALTPESARSYAESAVLKYDESASTSAVVAGFDKDSHELTAETMTETTPTSFEIDKYKKEVEMGLAALDGEHVEIKMDEPEYTEDVTSPTNESDPSKKIDDGKGSEK